MNFDWKNINWKYECFALIRFTLRFIWIWVVGCAAIITIVEKIPTLNTEDAKIRVAILVLLFTIANFTVIPNDLFWRNEKKKEVPK